MTGLPNEAMKIECFFFSFQKIKDKYFSNIQQREKAWESVERGINTAELLP